MREEWREEGGGKHVYAVQMVDPKPLPLSETQFESEALDLRWNEKKKIVEVQVRWIHYPMTNWISKVFFFFHHVVISGIIFFTGIPEVVCEFLRKYGIIIFPEIFFPSSLFFNFL
jgi:hypothetical protein